MSDQVVASVRKPAHPSRQINIVLRRSDEVEAETKQKAKRWSEEAGTPEPFAEIARELDEMVGMEKVKETIFEIYALLQISKYRAEAGLSCSSQVYHMIFRGNPGTGKTTVARLIAKLFRQMGVLSKGHFIEAERADLVGEYIGHTAIKTRELIKRALGGVLFIDEAYSLTRGGEKDFGRESIDVIVKSMEDYKDQFVLILAGYPDEMDVFMSMNPGLPSRFPIQIDFPDYTLDQLIQIAELMLKDREYVFMPQTLMKFKQYIQEEKARCPRGFSNARFVRNTIERCVRQQAVRLLKQRSRTLTKQELMLICPEDLKLDDHEGHSIYL
jgi:stage V sporulation protein K